MKVQYSGSIFRKELDAAGIEISRDGAVVLVERGTPLPRSGLCVVFDAECLAVLVDLLCEKYGGEVFQSPDFVPCRDDERILLVKIDDIEFFTAGESSVLCNVREGRTLEVKKKLYELEHLLTGRGFFRVSKSIIVNILEIKDISPWFGGRLLLRLKNGRDEIEVSRRYVSDFKEYLGV